MLDLIPVGVAVAHDPRRAHHAQPAAPRCARRAGRAARSPNHRRGHAGATGRPRGASRRPPPPLSARRTLPYRCLRDGRVLSADELPMRQAAVTGREVRNAEFDVVFDDGGC